MGVFSKNQGGKKTLKRNTYPVSRQINTTFNFGQLIPFSVREINPGESVKIRPSVGLRFMPTYFPVQNKMKCYINYFYVRSRNLYKDFKQFYEDNSPATSHPYLGFPPSMALSRAKMFSIGGLADHMGVSVTRTVGPTTLTSSVYNGQRNQSIFAYSSPLSSDDLSISLGTYMPLTAISNPPSSISVGKSYVYPYTSISSSVFSVLNYGGMKFSASVASSATGSFTLLRHAFDSSWDIRLVIFGTLPDSTLNPQILAVSDPMDLNSLDPYSASISFGELLRNAQESSSVTLVPAIIISPKESSTSFNYSSPADALATVAVFKSVYSSTSVVPVSESLSTFNPFSDTLNPDSFVPLNAMPFRAYEQIYNAFYRDERNNPLMKDGKPVYDEFLLNTDGGRDDSDYNIHYRNWEQDAYTTALPSPQQGIAPLVGISSSGIATFQDLESGKQYTVKSITDDSGDKVVNAEFTEDSLSDMNSDWKPSVARALVNYATSGISINDFRNVNALQRFKELNLRRGRKYKDLMEARFGVNISYAEMNMPEFIGGASFDVQPVQVNQTTNQGEGDPLGSYAGQLFASGGSKHSITKFCDEHGYIIGIISVVPTPVYETVTPKFFFKHHLLDFWQPEFNHIGLQPIPMKELDVFGQFSKSPDNMDEEFGYQRPWYDYISALDSVHGQFRTSLSSFVMYRSWSEPPSLSPDFLLVDPSSGIDDVFSVRTDSEGNSVDKILGQIYEDYTIKSPVSKFGIAKLE